MIRTLYERYLLGQVNSSPDQIPEHITIILSESDLLDSKGEDKFRSFISWCKKLGITTISAYVDVLHTKEEIQAEMTAMLTTSMQEMLRSLTDDVGFFIYDEKGNLKEKRERTSLTVHLSVGFGGRAEITKAITSVLSDVKDEKIQPEEIDESVIESYLLVQGEPDLIIRAGGKHLSDFLLWQSAYSELYFTDVNWHDLRKIDLLRVIRDFQKRQRRFGK
ncbi:polyprenyl diphosphate synthase [Methanococcoides sp. AM1]|uniref:polyprenyl diphosphate synthase n=1 Tax=Methanococcoides sp. AM1 TaxID=1201011 RepID=UPI0010846E4C|nr:polyprenyl diphosphate synthase [Methanococcoides sp. AM1]